MIDVIEDHRGVFGVEPICRVLPIEPSTYHQRVLEAREPERASARSQSDAALRIEIARVWEENRELYGARKIWHALRREGFDVARCTVERLMKGMGLKGVVRGRKIVTTNPDAARPCPEDKVNRQFKAVRPNQLWGEPLSAIGPRTMASDFTYVPSWSGTVYVAFVIDVFARPIVGWRVSTSMSTQFVLDALDALDALDQAIWQRNTRKNKNLIHYSDRGSQYLSITYTERLVEAGIDPPVGTVGDSYDNALAECVIGLFKTEVINALGPWRTMRDGEWETLRWIDWYTTAVCSRPSVTSRLPRPSRPTSPTYKPSTKPPDVETITLR